MAFRMSSLRLTVPLLGMALLAACGPRVPATPRPTAPTPTGDVPAPVTTTTPAAPITPVATPRASSWTVAWAPGFHEYVVTSRGAVHVEGDTLGPRDDSVATRARLTMRVSPTSAPFGVVVTVDSFLVSPGRGATFASTLPYPVVFSARLDTARLRMDFLADQPMLGRECAGPTATLLALARDLVPPLRAPLERGQRWTDSTTHHLCRSGVPLTVQSRHEWSVEGEVEQAGRVLLWLRRETQATVTGTGTGRRTGASVEGTARTSAEYLVDPTVGRVQQATSSSTAELRLREKPDAPVLTSRQEARQEAVLVERPAQQ